MHGHEGPVNSVSFSRDGDFICSGGADTTLMIWKNNLAGAGYPKKSKIPEDEGLSKPVTIPKKRNKSKTGLKCCKDKINKSIKSSSLNKFQKEETKTNNRNKNVKTSTISSKNSVPTPNSQTNINIYNSNKNIFLNNNTAKSNGMISNKINQSNNTNNNAFITLPPEMKVTFEKMISQLDLVAKTVKIFDQRIQSLEGQVSTLFNRQKKGFVQKQPPQMGDYQYLLENNNNFIPNNSINNNNLSQTANHNNFDYYTADVYNYSANFKETMNLNDENKKNIFKTEIDINQINKNNSSQQPNNDDNMYQGQIHEEFGYNGEEQVNEGEGEQVNEGEEEQVNEGEEEMVDENNNNGQYNQESENMNEQEYEEGQGEEYEEGQGEEYVNEEEYEEGYEEENGEEEVDYDYKNDENNGNNEENK